MGNDETQKRWSELLREAVEKPGIIADCYRQFYEYSLGNTWAAMIECMIRGIPMGPIATLKTWNKKGRKVKAGSKAIELCVPRTGTRVENDEEGNERVVSWTFFRWLPRFFVLSQTYGDDIAWPELPEWKRETAFAALGISEIPFEHANGNCQGYAIGKNVAINPLGAHPVKTLIHECAHIMLGHTEITAHAGIERGGGELEAEAVAYLVADALGIEGADESRGYIQAWYKEKTIPEKTAQRIFKMADELLKAGREASNGYRDNKSE